jgi:DNA-binding IclR family transcriptional regulator
MSAGEPAEPAEPGDPAGAHEPRTVAHSQTLDRGLRVLELLAEGRPASVADVATALGLHRSIVYRSLRTLEEHRLAVRQADGRYVAGVGLVGLARSVAADLRSVAAAELSPLAEAVGATAFLVVPDGDEAVTVETVEPRRTVAHVAYKPGLRHALDHGAPGLAVLAGRPPVPGERDEVTAARARGWARSTGEVLAGMSSIAAPVVTSRGVLGSVALVFVAGDLDEEAAARLVCGAAAAVAAAAP